MRLIQSIIEYAAPVECLVCGREGRLVCPSCLPATIITKRLTCYRCNRLSLGGRTCVSCRSSSALAGVVVASYYDGAVKELIAALKYRQASSAARLGASLLLPCVHGQNADIVTSVATGAIRFRQRGYNQAELIGRELARKMQLPYADLLARLDEVHQVGTSRQVRLHQVNGIFEPRLLKNIRGARILLVDDVVTTGATMAECARVLKAAGAKSIWGAAIAKH